MNKRFLIVAAHPDDEILGCGGTAARLINDGYSGATLILGEGITSRDEKRDRALKIAEIKALQKDIHKANNLLGIDEIFIEDFPDNRFDTVPLLDIIKVVSKVKDTFQPSIIFTHYHNDLNIDHQITARAVITATRPMHEERVKEIYSFEVLSSTEWNYPLTFTPDIYYDISDTISMKKKAMLAYKNEIREYPHPRSVEGIDLNAKYWGMRVGITHAEAFKTLRCIR